MGILDDLRWRYATKKFDPTKKVSEEDISTLKEAIQLSASSYGLQLYKVLVITNPEVKEKLRVASWNQPQLVDASHIFVFCNLTEITAQHIDEVIELRSQAWGVPVENLQGYGNFVKGKMDELSKEKQQVWMAKQNYIALGKAMAACGNLQIDSCPIEGFEPEKYDEILGLKEKGLTACVVLPVGYRSEEDKNQHTEKVRRPLDMLFEEI